MERMFVLKAVIIISIIGQLLVVGMICTHPTRKEPERYSNSELILYYKDYIHSDILDEFSKLKVFAKVIYDTHYNGMMHYNVQNAGGRHNLSGWSISGEWHNLNDTFPQVRNTIMSYYEDPFSLNYPHTFEFDLHYYYGIVWVERWILKENLSGGVTVLIYSELPEKEIMTRRIFDGFKMYSSDKIPQENDSWILNLDKYWYLCSCKEYGLAEY